MGDDVGGAPLEGGGCGGGSASGALNVGRINVGLGGAVGCSGGGAGADGAGVRGGQMVNERNQGRDGAPCWLAIVFFWKIGKMISNARCAKFD